MIRNLLIFLMVSGIIAGACEPPEKISPIPEITFKSFVLEDYIDSLDNRGKMGTLKFDFIDGDADIGSYISEEDTNEAYLLTKYNVFLIPFEKLPDGHYDSVETDPVKYIIRYNEKLDRVGQNKTIKGGIKINIQYTIIPTQDTLRYEFFILDRARHKSNVAYTSDIGFR